MKTSAILPSNSLGPRPGEVGQGGLKVLRLWRHSQKTRTPNHKNIFIFSKFFFTFKSLKKMNIFGLKLNASFWFH